MKGNEITLCHSSGRVKGRGREHCNARRATFNAEDDLYLFFYIACISICLFNYRFIFLQGLDKKEHRVIEARVEESGGSEDMMIITSHLNENWSSSNAKDPCLTQDQGAPPNVTANIAWHPTVIKASKILESRLLPLEDGDSSEPTAQNLHPEFAKTSSKPKGFMRIRQQTLPETSSPSPPIISQEQFLFSGFKAEAPRRSASKSKLMLITID